MKQKVTLISIFVLSILFNFCGSVFGEEASSIVTEAHEDSFIAKLGTFLFITAVLIFLLQWRQRKRK
ncbi:hypothetical protein [Acetobacterium sp.]|uniref:hypothetical protein n=1 Tax=Acetobacterium sp. TaxID=1872094 RepID=UPI002F3F137F